MPTGDKMLEYFTYNKFKKHRDAKAAGAEEVLAPQDEEYFERIVEADDAPREIPLTSRVEGEETPAERATTPSPAEGKDKPKHHWKADVTEFAGGMVEKAKGIKLPAFRTKDGKKKEEGD